MTEPILVLAWLVLAHLAADFLFQTGCDRPGEVGHGAGRCAACSPTAAIVAICLIPVGLA
jgi:hypothetical protein